MEQVSVGIEMLGDYDKDDFSSGRGLAVRENTVAAMATLSAVLGLDPSTIKLHREDKATTHACPGVKVRKIELINEVQQLMTVRHTGEHLA
jgi:hypothetical protein